MKTSQITAILMYGVIGFQAALILGAPWGAFTQGGRHPGSLDALGRGIAAVSIVLLFGMAQSILAQDGKGVFKNVNRKITRVLAWMSTAYAALGIIANIATPSQGERLIWAPISTVIFVLSLMTMRRTKNVK